MALPVREQGLILGEASMPYVLVFLAIVSELGAVF